MSLWTEPMAGLDLETTGTDVAEDRIVTWGLVYDDGMGGVEVRQGVLRPGIPIPQEAADIHGYTDERVALEGQAPELEILNIVRLVADVAAQGVPLTVYNAPFDLSMLNHEAVRYGFPPLPKRTFGPVVDPLVIDKQFDKYRPGSRRLADVARLHGVEEREAHDVVGDIRMSIDLARALLQRHGSPDSWRHVHHAQIGWRKEQQMSFAAYKAKRNQPGDFDLGWPFTTTCP